MVAVLALAVQGCTQDVIEIDLSFVVVGADAIADVQVEAVDASSKTTTVRVDRVEWQSPRWDSRPPRRLRMWWWWQELDAVEAGDRLIAVLQRVPEVVEEKGGDWQATYVLDGDSLEPFPAQGGDSTLTTANEELADLYGSEQLSRRAKLERLVGYVEEQT